MPKLCPGCNEPMLEGQALNGLAGTHWGCQPPDVQEKPLSIYRASPAPRTHIKARVASEAQLKRFEWIRTWMSGSESQSFVNVLDSEFVNAYIEANGARWKRKHFGAPNCPQLVSDLGLMYQLGLVLRRATGTAPGDSGMGFPKWVYVYSLKEKNQ